MASAVNFQVIGPIYEALVPANATDEDKNKALGWTLTIAAIATIFSFVGALVMGMLDKRRSSVLGQDLIEQTKVKPKGPFVFCRYEVCGIIGTIIIV